MHGPFDVFDVLLIAEGVQAKGAEFCERAAERFSDEDCRSLYGSLARWRTQNQEAWRRIRCGCSERRRWSDAADEGEGVPSPAWMMAGLTVYGTDLNSHAYPAGCETREEILQDAIRRSQGIIVFYRGVKAFSPGEESHMMIDNLICEEDRHTRLLISLLEQIRTPAPADDRTVPVVSLN
jgi:hypothetical protein